MAPDRIFNSRGSNVGWRWGFIWSIGTAMWNETMLKSFWLLIEDPRTQLLEHLHPAGVEVDDLRRFAHLVNLRALVLWPAKTTSLTSLEGVEALRRLTFFNINRSEVADIEPIVECPLETLVLQSTLVHDLKPLARHPTLEYLSVDYTRVTDLTPLFECPKLERVSARTCELPPGQIGEAREHFELIA